MPRTAIPITTLTGDPITGGVAEVAGTACDVANGNVINNISEHMWLEISNSAGSSGTVTLVTPGKSGSLNIEDPIITVPATTNRKRYGPFSKTLFGDNLEFNGSAATLTVSAYQTLLQ